MNQDGRTGRGSRPLSALALLVRRMRGKKTVVTRYRVLSRYALGDRILFAAILIAGLLAFGSIALPFAVKPGALALNYVQYSPHISSAGMPTRSQFAQIAGAGFDVVVNLAPPQVLGSHGNEAELVERQGMRYFNIPVDFASPRKEDFERFARIMRENREKRVFVHCQINLRASSFVFLYHVTELGEDPDQAFDDVARVWQPNAPWRQFIRETLAARGRSSPLALENE